MADFSLILKLILVITVLGITSGNNPYEGKYKRKLPQDSSLESPNEHPDWRPTKGNSRWNPGEFGLERPNARDERRRQKKIERRKERQERREERRKNRHRPHGSKPVSAHSIALHFPDDSSHRPSEGLRPTINNVYRGDEFHNGGFGLPVLPQSDSKAISDTSWLENNITSIWFTLQHIQKDIKQLRRQFRASNQNRASRKIYQSGLETSTAEPCDPEWEVQPNACIDDQGLICGKKGVCSCGQCLCDSPNYGIHCRCNDMICERHDAVLCGGAGRGQCRCGACVCRPEFTGRACECSLSTSECRKANEHICNGKGDCVCNRCQCRDGFTGKYCDESIYSASICERLKPCVLCMAYGKKYPQCEECNIKVQIVDELESSRATCLMINLGCILKYAYITPQTEGEQMTVLVKRERSCP